MKFSDIFADDESRADIAIYNQRISFKGGDKCRIYRFDKKIGVPLSLYCDYFDVTALDPYLTSTIDLKEENEYLLGNYLYLEVEAKNVETNSYEKINLNETSLLELTQKGRSKVELILSPEHINDDSKYSIRIHYRFVSIKQERKGFLLRNFVRLAKSSLENVIELTGVLLFSNEEERSQSINQRSSLEEYDDLNGF